MSEKTPAIPAMTGSAKWLVLVASVLFVAIRLAIIITGIDHLSHASGEEGPVVVAAKMLAQSGHYYNPFVHLWGYRPTMWALIALMKLGLSDMAAPKILALLVSLLGFVSLISFVAWRWGTRTGMVLAALFIFPSEPFLKWSLMTWGAYPEAASLILLPLALFGVALESRRAFWPLAAGITAGLVLAFSPSVAFVPLAMFAVLLLPVPVTGWFKKVFLLILGTVIGLSPLLWWFSQDVSHLSFEAHAIAGNNTAAIPLLDTIRAPAWSPMVRLLVDRLEGISFYGHPWQTVLVLFSAVWLLVVGFWSRRDEARARWQLVFPLTLVLGTLMIATFRFAENLDMRHVLWFFPAGLVCVGFFLSERPAYAELPVWRRRLAPLETVIKSLLLLLLVTQNAVAALRPIDPLDGNMLGRYRGVTYQAYFIYHVLGPEVDAVNCVLDQLPERMREMNFRLGFSKGFLIQESWNHFLYRPNRLAYDFHTLTPPPTEAERIPFFTGLGCAMAVKAGVQTSDFETIARNYGLNLRTAAESGFALCRHLSCLPQPSR